MVGSEPVYLVVMSVAPIVPTDCMACGACCHGDGARYLPINGADYGRLGEASATLTHFLGNRCYLRLVNGRCIALRSNIDGKAWSCSVYVARPTLCRVLERGSIECLAVLERQRASA